MARPKKQTVDYFPHCCNHRKTMYILEQRYGNHGYAFWFKLLEILGDTKGHYIDFNDDATWEFLQAKTHKDSSFCQEIMDLLAKLYAIDRELWQCRVAWSQNFVDGIADVYKNRRVALPVRPSFYIKKSQQADVSTVNKPQTKLKETKLNNTILPDFIERECWDAYMELRKRKRAPLTEKAKVLLIKKLTEFHSAGDGPNEVLQRSVMNGWTGIFPLDKKGGQDGAHRGHLKGRQLPPTYRSPEEIFGNGNS